MTQENQKVTIIAECCQNHKGDARILKDMIWAAAEAGADYVKIQSMRADDLAFREQFEEGVVQNEKTKVIKRPFRAEYDRLKPMDLSDDAHRWFIEECAKAGVKPLTTVFSRNRVKFLASLPWKEIKVASYDCVSIALLKDLREYFEHLFISTGATLDDEIEATARFLNGHKFAFLHCVTIYPTPLDSLHLARMDYLRTFTPSVGFSDHTLVERDGIKASIAARYYGADVIERHFTLLDRSQTKDGPISINAQELKELVSLCSLPNDALAKYVKENIPEFKQCIGNARRTLTETELLNRDYYRGRFASKRGNNVIYNWEEEEL